MYTCSDAQQFIETVLELNGRSFKNRDLVIQPLTEMAKLQQSGKRNNYKPYGGLSFWAKQGGKGRGNGYSWGELQASKRQKNRQQQPRPNKQIPPRQGDNKAGPSNLTKGAPDNVEAPARAETLRRGYSYVGAVHTPKPRTRELRTVNNVG